jgi:glutamyl-tRNA reductase
MSTLTNQSLIPVACPLSPRQALDEATHFRFPCAGDLMHLSLHRFLCTPRDFEGNRHRVHLFMLGASHERAPLAIRERLAFNGDDLTTGLQALSTIAHEGVILSTCNRTEIYALFDDPAGRQQLRDMICATRDLPPDLLDDASEEREGRDAIQHLLRVASGLDSVVLGEPQILSQVQFALRAAREAQIAGPVLTRLCNEALRTGKLARTRTGIARNRLSIAHAGVDLATRWLDGLSGRKVVVVGAGEIGGLTARILRNTGVADLVITNRTLSRAEALASDTGGRAIPLASLRSEIATADAVFVGTVATGYLIDLPLIGERTMPLIAVDLSVPRAIDPETANHPLVRLATVDDLDEVTAAQREKYEQEVHQAEALVADATDTFCDWWRTREVVPTIAALRDRAEAIRESELERALRRLHHLSDRDRNQVEALSVAIVNKLLHDPITGLKSDALDGTHEDAEVVIRRLFGVSPHPTTKGTQPHVINHPLPLPGRD